MKSLSYAAVLLTWMPLLTTCGQPINKDTSAVNYLIGLVAATIGGYVVFDMGKELGFWAYPSTQELRNSLDEIKHMSDAYNDVYKIFVHATDPAKEMALYAMSVHARYLGRMHNDVRILYALLRKINGRLQQLRVSARVEDQDDILELEREEAALHALTSAIESLQAHGAQHKDYFKLYAAEQECTIAYAYEFKLYAMHHADMHTLGKELFNYSTYRYTDTYGFVLLRDKLKSARKKYGALLGTLAQPYPQLIKRFQHNITVLYTLEQAIETHALFAGLERAYQEYLDYLAEKPE